MELPGINVNELNKQICQVLDTRDIRLIEEILAGIQFQCDLARIEASRQRVRTTVEACLLARNDVTHLHAGFDAIGLLPHFDNIAMRRREAFKSTPFYQTSLPHLVRYYNSYAHLVSTNSVQSRKEIPLHHSPAAH
jgi:hypothetical protein